MEVNCQMHPTAGMDAAVKTKSLFLPRTAGTEEMNKNFVRIAGPVPRFELATFQLYRDVNYYIALLNVSNVIKWSYTKHGVRNS
jgi:hypothetical protein